MRLLLDTHVLLWAAGGSRRLPAATRMLLTDPENEVYFSAASIWEVAIKSALRKPDFQVDAAELIAALDKMEFAELPVRAIHAAEVARLPSGHKDPFDRLLVAQAISEPLILLTNDDALLPYSDNVRLMG